MDAEGDVSEVGRALWQALWIAGLDLRRQWPKLTSEDRRLLTGEVRELMRLVRKTQTNEG